MSQPEDATSPLKELSSLLWGDDRPLKIVTGSAALDAPPGQRYLPVPPGRSRLLIPLEGRHAAAGSAIANLRLHHRRERIPRRLLAAALRTGLPQRALVRNWQGVFLEDGSGSQGPSLLEVLREGWRPDVAALSFSIRTVTPNYKPTLVALDRHGRPLGFAKLGVNAGTNARLDQETEALRDMAKHPVSGLKTPRLLADLKWLDCRIAVVEPIPSGADRYPVDARAPLHLLRAALATGRTRSTASVARALADKFAGVDDELQTAGLGFVERLERDLGDCPTAIGRTHGDWVPWNMSMRGTECWAWDWEHSDPEGCLGLDVAHWHQLVCLFRRGQSVDKALVTARARLRSDLERAGVVGDEAAAVSRLADLHVASRNSALYVTSGLWREDMREGILRILTD